ncbi:MAG TPA: GNAT family N-acetyltransferase [Beijerinckiaceae bacterium]|jgi:aminoglycoside 6'-N-acetyltransferase|nr:aminoglycoside 6-N-acetyltransferase [Microvirga sp.]HZB38573.1 GNAT family N-acetyltransferase [Beijerinckiaceae bacterium]
MRPSAVQPYSFRPVVAQDLPLLGAWLERPHVAEWWDDTDDKLAEIREAMTDPSTRPFMAALDGRPIGYIQCYDPHLEADHPYRDQPKGTLGIDQFIGEPELVGIGHGSRLIAAFVDGLFRQGAARILTDPDPRNARAIRAYEKAGFRAFDSRTTIYGDALMMARDAPDSPAGNDAPKRLA